MNAKVFHPHYGKQGWTNCEVNWYSGDTEIKFKKHLNNHDTHEKLKKFNWVDADITYKFNQFGFRTINLTEDIQKDDTLLVLGCSITFGEGIYEYQRYSELLGNKLGLKSINLGVVGGSADTIFRLASYWIPYIKPKVVVILEPEISRKELIVNNTPINLLINEFFPENLSSHDVYWKEKFNSYKKFYEDWISNDFNLKFSQLKTRYAIEHLCNKYNVSKLIIENVMDVLYIEGVWQNREESLGRDLAHPGSLVNERLARIFYEKIKNS